MKLEDQLQARSGNTCELCKAATDLKVYAVLPEQGNNEEDHVLLCDTCRNQIDKKAELVSSHWNCLSESMWSEVPGAQVLAWRMLNRLRNESWAADNLDMMYMDDDRLAWAKATGDHDNDGSVDLHKDCNGQVLLKPSPFLDIANLDFSHRSHNKQVIVYSAAG